MLFLYPTKRQTWVTYLTDLTTKSIWSDRDLCALIQWTRPRITIKPGFQRHLTEAQLIAYGLQGIWQMHYAFVLDDRIIPIDKMAQSMRNMALRANTLRAGD